MKGHHIGEFEEVILLIVAANNKKAYGVLIYEILDNDLNRKVNISAVHVVLKRLEKKGMVKAHVGGITNQRGGRRKKFYEITALGKQLLDQMHETRVKLYQKIPKISFQ